MQNEKSIYEWSITKRQRSARNYIAGDCKSFHPSFGMVGSSVVVMIMILLLWLLSGESLWVVILAFAKYFALLSLILIVLYFLGGRSPMASRKDDNEIAETYEVSDSGIEIGRYNRPSSFLQWVNIDKATLYSHTPWSHLQGLFGGHTDAIMLVTNGSNGLEDLVVDNFEKKEEIFNYIKNKISLNPSLRIKQNKSFRLTMK